MRYLVLLLLFVFCIDAKAQTAEEETYGPKILAVDTVLSFANIFTSELVKLAPGYKLAFTDRGTPGVLKHIFKTDENETLRFEYKYSIERHEGKAASYITSQRITGDGSIIAAIYNFLFGAEITADKLGMASAAGSEVVYKNDVRKMLLEPDDYAPGYWSLAFF